MRSFITSLPAILATLCALAVNACDTAGDEPTVAQGELAIATPDETDVVVPMCRAAATTGASAIDGVLAPLATCEIDADCTITVTETRCTGELTVAVSVADEESFLLLADKVDARYCAEVPPSCGVAGSNDASALDAVCVAGRCQIAE